MHLYDLFGYREYMQMRDQGYIRENIHPTLDLKIINYTEKAQYDNEWNNVTAKCRGLIVNYEGSVIARPFDKFMNYGQNTQDQYLMDHAVIVTDKMDGSLGILWKYKGEQGIATRGSFTSDQAIHATELWHRKSNLAVPEGQTYLFEIVYPGNRIVLDYGDMDTLVLLGVRDIETGSVRLPEAVTEWRGPVTTTYPYKTLRQALEAPQRPNAEGFVVYFPELDYRIKIKQDDYIALHKIVTGLTERRVWENLKEGKTLQDICEIVPDEWHDWLKKTVQSLMTEYYSILLKVTRQFQEVCADLPLDFTRKDFALKVQDMQYASFMFSILDGKAVNSKIWDLVRPSAE
jgi:RNA ligase